MRLSISLLQLQLSFNLQLAYFSCIRLTIHLHKHPTHQCEHQSLMRPMRPQRWPAALPTIGKTAVALAYLACILSLFVGTVPLVASLPKPSLLDTFYSEICSLHRN